jgi:omega-amidase
MKVIAIQLDIAWENKLANYAKVRALCAGAGIPAGSLIVLPEMFATGFSMNLAATLEEQPSETERFLSELARRYESWIIGGLVASGTNGRGRNEAVALSPEGELVARYCKCQPFSLGGETEHHEAGEEIVTFKWNDLIVAPLICYDLRFPELFRSALQRGAHLFVVIANWPVKREGHWIKLLQARAIENQAYVVGVNRCGDDPHFQYSGRSLIVNPHGDIIADAGSREGMISAEVDEAKVSAWRAEFPAVRDMRRERS